MIDLDDFSYEDDLHLYKNGEGIVRPSVTGTLKTTGIVNFSMVDPAVLEDKRVLGDRVHRWTARHDLGQDPDPMELTIREMGYAQSWLNFKRDFCPEFLKVEVPMLRQIRGMEVGGTPDAVAMIRRKMWIIDKKCCSSVMPAWELQLSDYEMMITGLTYLGIYNRVSVRLGAHGQYFPTVYSDPQAAVISIAALALTYNPGDKRSAEIISTYKFNKKIRD